MSPRSRRYEITSPICLMILGWMPSVVHPAAKVWAWSPARGQWQAVVAAAREVSAASALHLGQHREQLVNLVRHHTLRPV